MDTNGLPSSYDYDWVSVDASDVETIVGNNNTYSPDSSDVDKTIKVEVSFTDLDGFSEGPLTSDAVGPVVAAEPQACVLGGDVWCATLTVQDLAGPSGHGCANSQSGKACSNPSHLTEDEFRHDGTDYDVTSISVATNGDLKLWLAPDPTAPTRTLVLVVDGERFALAHSGGSTSGGRTGRSWDSSGLSWSTGATVALRLVEGFPPLAPAAPGVNGVDNNDTSLKVTWSEPDNAGPPITHYDLRYRTGSGSWQSGPQGETGLNVTITGLTTGTPYDVQVRASNADGDGPWSPSGQGTPGVVEVEETHPNGALRLADGPDAYSGRLEVFFRGDWGTVCDDRFDRPFVDYSADHPDPANKKKVPNIAGARACQILGHETGEMVSRSIFTTPEGVKIPIAPKSQPIWLDDVRCSEATHGTVSGLQHCYHAGVNLHNCGTRDDPDHEEDVHLKCVPKDTTRAALTAEFVDVPAEHSGEEFSFRIEFSEPVVDLEGQDLVNGPLMLTGAQPVRVALVDDRYDLLEVFVNPTEGSDVSIGLESGHDCYRRPTETDPHLPGKKWTVCTRELYTQDGTVTDVGLPLPLSESVSATVVGKPLLTAAFSDIPDSHGGIHFAVGVEFSEDLAPGFELPAPTDGLDVSSGVLDVSNARIDSIVQGLSGDPIYLIRLTPIDLGEPVRIVLLARHPCNFAGAACTPDGRRLSGTLTITVPAGAVIARSIDAGPAPLTAWFKGVPAEHDGENEFPVELWFSEPPAGPGWYGARNIAVENAIDITGGAVVSARSIEQNGAHRRIVVQPSGTGAVTLSLPPGGPACDQAGALCTEAGGRLEVGALVQIQGPAALSVADAEVREGPGAALAFLVTLDRSTSAAVQVDYATRDGTAQAGSDYTANSGTLNFAPGETAKTVSVAVLDDSHDEGSETLTLVLSNPSGAYIEDGEATGTIENSDYMPQAWLGRFGRTVADQVLDAVEERIRSAPRAGMQVTMAGHRFDGEATETEALEEAEARAWLETCRDGSGVGGDCPARTRSRAVTERDLLTGSSFALTTGADAIGGGLVSLWGRGAVSRFDGREGDLSLSGEVTGALLGADWTRERWTTGLMLSRTRGEGSYRGANSGEVSSTVTGLYPYGRYALTDRVTVWGAAGYGAGTLTLTPEDDETYETDMDLVMAAAGLRGVVVEAPADGGLELAVKTDALAVRTSSEATGGSAGGNLAAAEADVTRLRLGLEGTWRGLEIGTGTLAPRLEVGVRHDGGDAETGFGLDLGGGLAWSDPGTGIRAELSGRGLLSHASDGFRDRGIAGSFGWDPTPDSDRGPSLTLSQTLGVSARGGADALLGRTTLAGLAANDPGNELDRRRLELKLGYGFGAFDDRFTATPEVGLGCRRATGTTAWCGASCATGGAATPGRWSSR